MRTHVAESWARELSEVRSDMNLSELFLSDLISDGIGVLPFSKPGAFAMERLSSEHEVVLGDTALGALSVPF